MAFLLRILTAGSNLFASYRIYLIIGGLAALIIGGGYYFKLRSEYDKGYRTCQLDIQQATLTKQKDIEDAKSHAQTEARNCLTTRGVYDCLRSETPHTDIRKWYDLSRLPFID